MNETFSQDKQYESIASQIPQRQFTIERRLPSNIESLVSMDINITILLRGTLLLWSL